MTKAENGALCWFLNEQIYLTWENVINPISTLFLCITERQALFAYMKTHARVRTHTHTHTHTHRRACFHFEKRDLKWELRVMLHPQWGGKTVFRLFCGCSRAPGLTRGLLLNIRPSPGNHSGRALRYRVSPLKARLETRPGCRAGGLPGSGVSRVLSAPQLTNQD